LSRVLRQASLFLLLLFCLAGCAVPVWPQESRPAEKQKESEPPHALLYKTINFVILVGGLAYVLRKPLADFFDSRSAAIRKALEEGKKALETSQAQLKAVQEKLSKLEAEIAAFRTSAAAEMEAERQRLERASAEEAERILESARLQMAAALRAAQQDLKNYTADQAVSLAEQLIRNRLDEAGQKRLVAQFAASLETKERKN
jgi:F-type H+-transporting ATPase subunit b